MSDKSKIQWTEASWNPIRGCSKVSDGCKFCYAMAVAARFCGPGQPYEGLAVRTPTGPQWTNAVRLVPGKLAEPLHWTRPRLVFVNSMSDLFHPDVPEDFIDRVFAVMAACPRHTFQVLTKRPGRMRAYANGEGMTGISGFNGRRWRISCAAEQVDGMRTDHVPTWPLPNVWLGVSAEDQSTWDARVPDLLHTPAAVRWVSAEPLLGPIDGGTALSNHRLTFSGRDGILPGIDWLVAGGESGTTARPCHLEHVRSLAAQCRAAGVPVFVKQLGSVPIMAEKAWLALNPAPMLKAANHKRAPEGAVPLLLRDRKGGDMEEWPADLRVRNFPFVASPGLDGWQESPKARPGGL